jgi:Tol biopolymer transport system component
MIACLRIETMLRFFAAISILVFTILGLATLFTLEIGKQFFTGQHFTYMDGILYQTPGYRGMVVADVDRNLTYLLAADSSYLSLTNPVSWSADGKQFIYGGNINDEAHDGDIYLVTMTDFQIRNRSIFPNSDYWSVWNGEKFAYVVTGATVEEPANHPNIQFSVVDLENGQTLYTSQPDDFQFDRIVSPLIWSSNGVMIAFISSTADYKERRLRMVNIDQQQIITPQPAQATENATNVVWSPDGRWLAFQGVENLFKTLWIMDSHTGEAQQVAEKFETGPAWSPDSQHLAYTIWEGALNESHQVLYVENIETGDIRVLTEAPYSDSQPAWSPDGRWLAVISNRSGLPGTYLVDALTGEWQQFASVNAVANQPPIWSPDGRWLAVHTTFYPSHTTYIGKIYLIDVSNQSISSILSDSGQLVWQP